MRLLTKGIDYETGYGRGIGYTEDTGIMLSKGSFRWEEGWGHGADTYPGHSNISFLGCGSNIIPNGYHKVLSDTGRGQPDDLPRRG